MHLLITFDQFACFSISTAFFIQPLWLEIIEHIFHSFFYLLHSSYLPIKPFTLIIIHIFIFYPYFLSTTLILMYFLSHHILHQIQQINFTSCYQDQLTSLSMINPNNNAQEPFSFESCQSDHFGLPLDWLYFKPVYCEQSQQNFHPDLNDDQDHQTQSNPQLTRTNTLISESSSQMNSETSSDEIIQTSNSDSRIIQEPSTSPDLSSSLGIENKIKHYKNDRRKKHQRGTLKKVFDIGAKFASYNDKKGDQASQKHQRLTSKLTKNLLAFGKKPILSCIRAGAEKEFFKENKWFFTLQKKEGINMEYYDKIFKCPELRGILSQFFKKKVLDRELMLSRTSPQSKIFYRYYLEIFERNFRKGSFKSISETMMQIQNQKKYL